MWKGWKGGQEIEFEIEKACLVMRGVAGMNGCMKDSN